MNFLIFRDFSRLFLNFYKFKLIYFELNSIYIYIYIYIYISCVDVAADMLRIATWRHMDTPCGNA